MAAATWSRSRVVTPGCARSSSARMVAATILPASRMIAISRADLSTMVLSVVGFRCIGPRELYNRPRASQDSWWGGLATRSPFLLGLTGNIACGKSSVGQLLAERYGADYVDADRLVHGLYAAGTPETRAIAERFGQDLLRPEDG